MLAELTWWLMVLGVAGVVITCLAFKFGGSWVFLYPIAFHSAGQWGEWTSFFFNLSVLSVGLSIVTWCLSILDTVVGPALHAVSTSIWNRLGVAMGFGYVAPKRFATNPRPVPYAVIPLTVIAIDMIIATLPLAVALLFFTQSDTVTTSPGSGQPFGIVIDYAHSPASLAQALRCGALGRASQARRRRRGSFRSCTRNPVRWRGRLLGTAPSSRAVRWSTPSTAQSWILRPFRS